MKIIFVVTGYDDQSENLTTPIAAFSSEEEANSFTDATETKYPTLKLFIETVELDPDWC